MKRREKRKQGRNKKEGEIKLRKGAEKKDEWKKGERTHEEAANGKLLRG